MVLKGGGVVRAGNKLRATECVLMSLEGTFLGSLTKSDVVALWTTCGYCCIVEPVTRRYLYSVHFVLSGRVCLVFHLSVETFGTRPWIVYDRGKSTWDGFDGTPLPLGWVGASSTAIVMKYWIRVPCTLLAMVLQK